MAYKKRGSKSKKDLTPEQRKKIAADKKAKAEAAYNEVLDKLYEFVATPRGEWSMDDGELDISFYQSKVAGFPMNFEGKDYRGVNAVLLIEAMEKNDVCVPKFATFNQVKDLIETDKEKLPPLSDTFDPDNPLKGRKTLSPVHKWLNNYYEDGKRVTDESRIEKLNSMTYSQLKENNVVKKSGMKWVGNVFALEQLQDILPKEFIDNDPMFQQKKKLDSIRMNPELENAYFRQKTENLIKAMGVEVIEKEGSQRCYFSPSQNHIVVPPRHRFKNEESRLAIVCHELVHSTGLPLNRKYFAAKSDPNFDLKYSKEEVLTEMATSFIAYRLGINSFTAHAKYMKSYADTICQSDNKKVLTNLSTEAMKASDYVMEKLEAYELKQKLELEQKLPNALEATDLRITGDTIYQTYRSVNEPDKSFIVEVDLKDLDKDTFINEKHLTDFAKNHRGSKSISEFTAGLKADLKDHTVLSFETNRVVLQAQEQERIKAKAEQKQDVSQQVEQKQTKRSKLSA